MERWPINLSKVLEYEKLDLDVKSNLIIFPWVSAFREGKLYQINGNFKGFSTILNWSWSIIPIVNKIQELNFDSVFCVSPNDKIKIKQHCFPYYVKPEIFKAKEKDILYSFIGWDNNPIRNKIFKVYSGPSVIKREEFFENYKGERMKDYEFQYINILARSRFSLCPRGIGSGSFRFWESLRAGSIPILMSNEYKLPVGFDWENTIIRIDENKFINNPRRVLMEIESISKEQEELMRNNCLKADANFSNSKFLSNYIEKWL